MAQHFLLSPAARALSLAGIMRMSDKAAFETFQLVRFAANGGEPFCPHCGVLKVYTSRRDAGPLEVLGLPPQILRYLRGDLP